MAGPSDSFLPVERVVVLLAELAAVDHQQARRWIRDVVRGGFVRLQDTAGNTMRYSETPQVAAARAARAARPSSARYNPHSHARGRGQARLSAATDLAPIEQLLSGGYACHLQDLEVSISREFEIRLELVAASKNVVTPAASAASPAAGPVAQILEFLHTNGRRPGFEKLSQDLWRWHMTSAGLRCVDADFAAAWRLAVEAGYVVRLDGAPTRIQQNKRLLSAAPAAKATGA